MAVIDPLRTEPSLRRPVFACTVLLAAILFSERIVEPTFVRVVNGAGDFPLWLPRLGMLEETQTLVYYLLLFDFLKFVVLPITLMWIAYAYGRYSADQS